MMDWAREIFAEVLKRDEPAWLKALRQSCFDSVMASGLPTKNDEDWKYSSPEFLAARHCEARSAVAIQPLRNDGALSHDHCNIVFVDGIFSLAQSNISMLPAGLTILPMTEALQLQGDFLKRYFETSVTSTFRKLNLALMQDGFFIQLSRDLISKPIHVTYISTKNSESTCKNLVIMGDGATATLIEEFINETDQAYFNHNVLDVYLGQRASLHYYKVQKEAASATHLANINVIQDRDSTWKSRVFSLGAAWSREDLSITLQGAGAQCELKGLYEIDGLRHADHHTRVFHHASHTQSHELYKGIMNHGATAVFNGRVLVHKGVKQVVAHQANHNLLLDKMSTVNTKPELEIYADDVQCTHGATIGRLDENQLFYLRARGIDLIDAKELLIKAFAMELMDDVMTSLRGA